MPRPVRNCECTLTPSSRSHRPHTCTCCTCSVDLKNGYIMQHYDGVRLVILGRHPAGSTGNGMVTWEALKCFYIEPVWDAILPENAEKRAWQSRAFKYKRPGSYQALTSANGYKVVLGLGSLSGLYTYSSKRGLQEGYDIAVNESNFCIESRISKTLMVPAMRICATTRVLYRPVLPLHAGMPTHLQNQD